MAMFIPPPGDNRWALDSSNKVLRNGVKPTPATLEKQDDPSPVSPTPATIDQPLTPLTKHQSASMAATASRVGARGLGVPAAIPIPISTSRRNSNEPRPLAMSIARANDSNRNSASGSGAIRQWSGYASGPPSSGLNSAAYMPYPEIQSDPVGSVAPVTTTNPGYALYAGAVSSVGYGQHPPMQGKAIYNTNAAYTSQEEAGASSGHRHDRSMKCEEASNVDRPSSHLEYDESLLAQPPTYPLPTATERMSRSSEKKDSSLPSGAVPPTMYSPGEKQI
ncbi:hypothetical protein BDV93DRAFT_504144 [Ceratobasidium sp. AG-I]|nr:hypothetical protein BDV93DRAFT_504144 [Ceratobasidium sp. AG-I]